MINGDFYFPYMMVENEVEKLRKDAIIINEWGLSKYYGSTLFIITASTDIFN